MGVLGLVMRLTQATVISLSPGWFYRLLTLHGVGMITGVLLVMMGALWFVLHETVPLDPAHARELTRSSSLALSACWSRRWSAASVPAGRSCRRCRSIRRVSGRRGRRACSSSACLLVGSGFFVFCLDVLEQTTTTYGGLTRTLGWQFLRGREQRRRRRRRSRRRWSQSTACSRWRPAATIVVGLLGRTYDDERRHRRPRRQEPRLLLRPLDREPDDLPGRRRRLRARAPLRRPALRTTKVLRRRLGRLAGLHRDRVTRITCTWTSSSPSGRRSSPRSPPTEPDPGRGDHDLLDDDARLGLPLPLDARLDPALRGLRRLGDRRHRRGDRLADPDQLPAPQHHLGRRPLPHLPDPHCRSLGARLPRPPARARRRPHHLPRRSRLDDHAGSGRRLRAHRHVVRRRRARDPAPLRDPAAGH